MRAAVFLDRDGVLNEVDEFAPASPRRYDDFVLIETAVAAANELHRHGFVLVVVTNQPDIGRSLMDVDQLQAMHDALRDAVPIDHIEVCTHAGSEGCSCRKPRPGMILRSINELGLDAARSWTIGDRWVDIAAGTASGTRTILIDRPYSFDKTSSGLPPKGLTPDFIATDLCGAAAIILADAIKYREQNG